MTFMKVIFLIIEGKRWSSTLVEGNKEDKMTPRICAHIIRHCQSSLSRAGIEMNTV